MGKKGVSAAEKRQKMTDMFQAECSVFTKKEIEKLAPKTGIVSGAVEQVLKELMSDDIVYEAKLSGTLFYWSFPGCGPHIHSLACSSHPDDVFCHCAQGGCDEETC